MLIAGALLLAHLLGLLHVALEVHEVDHDGTVHDIAFVLADDHYDDDAHVCAPEFDGHDGLMPSGCSVARLWQAAVEVQVPLVLRQQKTLAVRQTQPDDVEPAAPQDVLSRAPKNSPPLG